MKLTIYQKQKCVLARPYEATREQIYNITEQYDAIALKDIENHFVEKSQEGYLLIIEIGYNYHRELYIVDIYDSRKKAENAAKILI